MASEQTARERKQKRVPARRPTHSHSEADKIRAVTAMLTANPQYPLGKMALSAACDALGHYVHHETLRTWLHAYRKTVEANLVLPTTAEIVSETKDDILGKWQKVREVALDQLANEQKAKDAQYGQLVIAAGTAHDKIDRMTGLPAEDVALWKDLSTTAALAGVDHRQIIQELVMHLKAKLPTLQSIAREAQQDNQANIIPAKSSGE